MWIIERRLEFVLRVSLIRLLRIPPAMEEQVDGDGFPGTSLINWCVFLARVDEN